MPIQVDKAVLYGGILPMTKTELEEKVRAADLEMCSPFIPTLALKLWYAKNSPQNGFPISLLPTEKTDDACGFGHFPLLEGVGSLEPKLPESEEVEEQLCLYLKNVTGTNNVSPNRLESLLEPGTFPTTVTGQVIYSWPDYRGPINGNRVRIASGVFHIVNTSSNISKIEVRQ